MNLIIHFRVVDLSSLRMLGFIPPRLLMPSRWRCAFQYRDNFAFTLDDVCRSKNLRRNAQFAGELPVLAIVTSREKHSIIFYRGPPRVTKQMHLNNKTDINNKGCIIIFEQT